MKCILLWIKVIWFVGLLLLVACSSAPKKNSVPMGREGRAMEFPVPDKNVSKGISSKLQKEYEQALNDIKRGEYDKAEKNLESIIAQAPELAGPYINLGIIRLNEASLDEAEKWFVKAKAQSARNPEIYNYLGIIYRQQGRFKEAEQAYKKAIEMNSMFAKAYLNLGVLYDLYLPNYALAMNNYKQYQTFNPDDKRVETWIIDLGQRAQASN